MQSGCIQKERTLTEYGKEKRKKQAVFRFGLVLLNIVLVLTAVVVSLRYSSNIQDKQKQQKLSAFCSTIESMKQISGNYLQMELNYAKDWAKYIDEKGMTMDEALAYIKQANHQKDRYAHIVDMDTYNAYSTCERDGRSLHQRTLGDGNRMSGRLSGRNRRCRLDGPGRPRHRRSHQ